MGSWVGTSAGASVGSLLLPVCGLVGSGAGRVSLGGAAAPPLACFGGLPVLPSDLLVLASPSSCVASSSLYFGQSYLSSVSPPGASEQSQNTVLLVSTQAVYKAPHSTVRHTHSDTSTQSDMVTVAVGSLRAQGLSITQ